MADERSQLLKMGEVARRSGFSRQQLHNFLTMGLIREDSRTASGHRLFGAGIFRRLAMIRGLLGQYPLAELRRTWRGLLRAVLFLAALAGAGAPRAAQARAAEPGARLGVEDVAGIRRLFDGLKAMMLGGNAQELGSLLDPDMSSARRAGFAEQLEADLEGRSYLEFRCSFDENEDLEATGPGRARASVLISFRYRERTPGAVAEGDEHGQRWEFDLVRTPQGWRIADSPYFYTWASTQDRIFESIFLWAAIVLIVGCFWGWMFLDCSFRAWPGRKLPWLLFMLATLGLGIGAIAAYLSTRQSWLLAGSPVGGLGAVSYFFAVWMRQGPDD